MLIRTDQISLRPDMNKGFEKGFCFSQRLFMLEGNACNSESTSTSLKLKCQLKLLVFQRDEQTETITLNEERRIILLFNIIKTFNKFKIFKYH